MAKIGRPARLIAYDTDLNIHRREQGPRRNIASPRMRTLLYVAIIAAVGGVMTFALVTRTAQSISVLHDRNPVFVRLSDGAIRNAYTVRIANKRSERREFTLSMTGLAGSLLDVVQTARMDGSSSRSARTRPARCACSSPITPNCRRLHADQLPPL